MKKLFAIAAVAAMFVACGPKSVEDYVAAIEKAAQKGDTAEMSKLGKELQAKMDADSTLKLNDDQVARVIKAAFVADSVLEAQAK